MAAVEFYIRNYKRPDGTVETSETLFQTVPFTSVPVITNPKVKTEMGKAGSFEFGLEPGSPYYDAMMQMKTIFRIVYFGETLFRGRVLTIDRTLSRSRTVHCEGDLAFLLDTMQEGVKDEKRKEINIIEYMTNLISTHNANVDDPQKRFTIGNVPDYYSEEVEDMQKVVIPDDKVRQKFGNSSWSTTMDGIENLLSDFGGYWRTRYDSDNGTVYLDWYDNYYRPYDGQTIEVARNLIDLSGSTELENLFTVVVPIGKKNSEDVFITNWWPRVRPGHAKVNYIEVPELASRSLFSDAELNSGYHRKEDYLNAIDRYGKIWKVVDFENANTPEKLFTYCKDWIKNNYMPELTQWDVSALDLKLVGENVRPLFTGDRVHLAHPEVDQTFEAVSIISGDYDLYNPDKNKFKIGIPNQQINASYGVKQKNSTKAGSLSSVTDGLTDDKKPETASSTVEKTVQQMRDEIQQQYIRKTERHKNITIDDPMAFLKYETDGITEKKPEEVSKQTAETTNALYWTKIRKANELAFEAVRRGVSPDDTQLLIDYTPEVKWQQDLWRGQTAVHLGEDLGFSPQEISVLLYEDVSSSVLASWVDDDGNWTQAAYEAGIMVKKDPEKIREMAINTRKLLKEYEKSANDDIIDFATPWGTLGNINVGDVFSGIEYTDPITGEKRKLIDALGGFLNGETNENLSTQNKTSLFSLAGSLFDGSVVEDGANSLKTAAMSLLGDIVSGTKVDDMLTEGKQKLFNFLGTLFQGSATEDSEGGVKNQLFNFLGGLFTGSKTKPDDISEEDITNFFLGNGNAEIDGEKGTANFGEGYSWMVRINDTIIQQDGTKLTGFVSANDFQAIGEIPSFKTQIAVIKDLYVEQAIILDVQVSKLSAIEAYIDKINANTVTADSYVAADKGFFGTATVTGTVTAKDFKISVSGPDPDVNLKDCYCSAVGTFNDGTWTLTLNRIEGDATVVPFDLTATDWYKDQIAGAAADGWDGAYGSITLSQTGSSVVGPGTTVTIYPKAKASSSDAAADITSISAVLTAPKAIKSDKVKLTSDDTSNNVSKKNIIVHYSDRSTTNDLEVLIDASEVYLAGVAQGEEQGHGGYSQGYADGQTNVNADISSDIAYRSGTANYENGSLQIGADMSGSLTKTPEEGDPVVTALSKYGILEIAAGASAASLSIGDIICEPGVTNAGYYHITGSGGKATVGGSNGADIPVSVTPFDLSLALTPPHTNLGTSGRERWDTEEHRYVFNVESSLTVNSIGNVLTKTVTGVLLEPSDAIDYGKTLVTVSSVTRAENCSFDTDNDTAYDNVIIELDNGKKVVRSVDFSDVYRDALKNGYNTARTANYTVELVDDKGQYVGEEDFELNVNDIVYQGVHDQWDYDHKKYIYTSNGNLAGAYSKVWPLPNPKNEIGSLYPNTKISLVETINATGGIGKWYRIVADGVECYLYDWSYLELHTEPDSPSNYGTLRGWYYEEQTVTYDYTGKIDTNGLDTIGIYVERNADRPAISTLRTGETVYCMYSPHNFTQEWMPVKIGQDEGFVEAKYIVGTDAYCKLHPETPSIRTITIDHIYQNVKLSDNTTYTKPYDVSMKTVLSNDKVTVETEPQLATAYGNIQTNLELRDLSTYFNRINGFFGKMAVAGISEGMRYHKVEFTVAYSDGHLETYIVEIEVKNDVQSEVYEYTGFTYAVSGKTVNIRSKPDSKASVVIQVPVNTQIMCKYDPKGYAGIEDDGEGAATDTAEWMPVQYNGWSGYMLAKYIRTTNAYDEDPGGANAEKKVSVVEIADVVYRGTVNGTVILRLKDTTYSRPYKLRAASVTDWNIAIHRVNAEASDWLGKVDDAGHYARHPHNAPSSSILSIVVSLDVRYSDNTSAYLLIQIPSFPQ